MSASADILRYLAEQPATSLSTTTPQQIASAIGEETWKVSKLLWSLEHTDRLKLIREGRNVTGIAELRLTRHPSPAQAISAVPTPALDRYAQARAIAKEYERDMYVEVSFHEDSIAEEALKLREALSALESKYAELTAK